MRRPLLLLAMVVGLLAASVVAIALRPTVLGLDLQGGVEVILQGKPTEEAEVTEEAIDRSVEIIRERVDAFGVAEPEIQTQGTDQIVVALPGAEDPDQVVADLIQPAQMMFINFERNLVGPENGDPSLYDAVKRAQTAPKPDEIRPGARPTFYAFDKTSKELLAGPEVDRETIIESFPGDVRPPSAVIERVPKEFFLAFQERRLESRGDEGPGQRVWFVFQNNPDVLGREVTEARVEVQTGGFGGPDRVVRLGFTDEGGDKFSDATRQLATDGQLKGTPQAFAVILDGEIVTTPTIDYEQYPTGLGDDGAVIEGNFSQGEAETLAKQINSGALPIELEVISQKQVSATLGKQSLRQGLIAGIVGLALVILFLIAYYRFLGVVAAVGLIVYAVFLYAVAVLVPITLTLPGIAGIILTIGVAADANVVIFERVREEARSGKSPRAAILAGYRKGISAIIDANVVTLATAAILFLFATAGIKGFAFTLFIGVLLSLFTAVVATRAAFNGLAETRFLRDDRYMGLNQREIRWKMDVVARWKLWMAISFVPIAIGSVWIGFNGLNLGLDFESGTRMEAVFERSASEDAVRTVAQDAGLDDPKIQSTIEDVEGRAVRGFQIQTETLQPDQITELRRALDAEFSLVGNEFQSLETVGPVFGEQIIRNGIWAILLSFAVLIVYLTIRFEYKLALPALLTVVHDVWLSIAIYSVTGREITSATVAALLTILGYSLYDVVIVFDRIRENVPIMRRSSYRQIVNTSLHETLTRSMITSLTTLIPLAVLFLFGGDTLKDFAFALLVGILSGTLSSIGIAAPLAALWKEREPELRRRTAKAERRAARAVTDADVVDVEALERAEAALQAELRLEEGRPELEAGPDEELEEEPEEELEEEPEEELEEEPEEEPRALPSGSEDAEPPVEAPVTAEPEPAPEDEATPVPSGDGEGPDAAAQKEEKPPRPRPRPGPERVRRHRQVQKRRRR
jgi:SecD/SecF fusion protein